MIENSQVHILNNFPLVLYYQNIRKQSKQFYMSKRQNSQEIQKPSVGNKLSITQRLYQQFQQIKSMFSQAVKINKISHNYYEVEVFFKLTNPQSRYINSFSQQNYQKNIKFVIIVHEMYPFKPPFVVSSSHVMFPRLDDYRDFMDHLIENWWPSVTIVEVIEELDEFVKKVVDKSVVNLLNPILETSFLLGHLNPSMTFHCLDTIDRHCRGAKLCRGEYFEKQEDVLIGKYEKMIVCVSWSNVSLFKECPQNKKFVRIVKSIKTKDIKKITIKNKKIKEKKSMDKVETIYFYDVNIQLGDKSEYIRITTLKSQLNENQSIKIFDGQSKGQYPYLQVKIGGKQKVVNEFHHPQQSFQNGKQVRKDLNIIEDFRDQDNRKNRKYSFEDQFKEQDSHIKINFEEEEGKQGSKKDKLEEKMEKDYQTKIKVDQQRQDYDIFQSHKSLQLLRNVSQYIQLREFFLLPQNQSHDSQIRILTQIIQNSSDLEGQQQLKLFYQMKLKQVLCKKVLAIERNQKNSLVSNKSFSQF